MGDFGNVVKDAHGEVTINFIDRTASLVGGQSILHRGIVVSCFVCFISYWASLYQALFKLPERALASQLVD